MCFSQCHGLHTMQVYCCSSIHRGFQLVLCTMIVLNKKKQKQNANLCYLTITSFVFFFFFIFLTGAKYQTTKLATTVQTLDLFQNASFE